MKREAALQGWKLTQNDTRCFTHTDEAPAKQKQRTSRLSACLSKCKYSVNCKTLRASPRGEVAEREKHRGFCANTKLVATPHDDILNADGQYDLLRIEFCSRSSNVLRSPTCKVTNDKAVFLQAADILLQSDSVSVNQTKRAIYLPAVLQGIMARKRASSGMGN